MYQVSNTNTAVLCSKQQQGGGHYQGVGQWAWAISKSQQLSDGTDLMKNGTI